MFSILPVKVRIFVRRCGLFWHELPGWSKDGLTACAIALPLWIILVLALLVF